MIDIIKLLVNSFIKLLHKFNFKQIKIKIKKINKYN